MADDLNLRGIYLRSGCRRLQERDVSDDTCSEQRGV